MSLDRPYSGLIAEGFKWIDTRGRLHPWRSAIGETIAVHATIKPPVVVGDIGEFQVWNESGAVWWLDGREGDVESNRYWALVAGAIVATAHVDAVVPITWKGYVEHQSTIAPCVTYQKDGPLELHQDGKTIDVSDQRQYGIFCYERFAVLLSDVEKVDPVPCRGHQGLWTVPAEVEAQVLAARGR